MEYFIGEAINYKLILMKRLPFLQHKQNSTKSVTSLNNNDALSSISKTFFQPKLTVNQPNDRYEQEADAMADKVIRMKDDENRQAFFFKPAPITSIQKKCEHCEEEEKKMQRKESNNNATVTSSNENYINSLSGGKPLNESEKNFFESGIGYDFSKVRLHNDARANESAKSLNALAYTNGNNIVFGPGQYHPGTNAGKKLLAHELTHVVQQSTSDNLQTKLVQRYSGCSSTQDKSVSDDHKRAREMLGKAIDNISSYDGTTPTKVHDALATHFNGATSNAFAAWINTNLRLLYALTWMAGYECFTGGILERGWACTGSDLATTFWCIPNVDIRLCPSYFGQSDIERSTTMIHEWVHKYGCNFDLGYEHEKSYKSNSTTTQLLNADSFSNLVRDVQ